ncbi:MAG: transcription antitermination factor NusB [Pseudobdellovibrio sp.]|uniref:transcription antitermination factor NusB n=1 Tax=Pseudobdellovibrio sp. HCB154 TaxID=3386277 RepID=UPI0039175C5D|nr:transcription antitermination factor NusB [Pseudobdellovibrio sp.]
MSLSDLATVFDKNFEEAVLKYTYDIVRAVQANKEKIDAKIQEASRHWKVDRMASVDRNIIRIAVCEILFTSELIEPKIAMNEAIEIAKQYGTQEAASFVNGIVDQVIRNERR